MQHAVNLINYQTKLKNAIESQTSEIKILNKFKKKKEKNNFMDEIRCYKQNQSSSVIESRKVLLFFRKTTYKSCIGNFKKKICLFLWA